MLEKAKIVLLDCAREEEILACIEGEVSVCVVASLDEIPKFSPSYTLVLVDKEQKDINKLLERDSSPGIVVLQGEGEFVYPNDALQWIREPASGTEILFYVEKAAELWMELSRLRQESKRHKAQMTIQSDMNDRLIETSQKLKEANRVIEQLSQSDALTGIHNRRFFDQQLMRDMKQSVRYRNDLSLCLLDIDNFKFVNDTMGHQVGDQVLKRLAQIIVNNLRETDWVARYGGEEFICVLPQTNIKGATTMADRLRRQIENELGEDVGKMITSSIGLSSFNPDTMTHHDLVEFADRALYHAKNTGKNKVVIYNESNGDFYESSSGTAQPSYR